MFEIALHLIFEQKATIKIKNPLPPGSGLGSAQNLRFPEGNGNPDPPPGPPGKREGGAKNKMKNRLKHS